MFHLIMCLYFSYFKIIHIYARLKKILESRKKANAIPSSDRTTATNLIALSRSLDLDIYSLFHLSEIFVGYRIVREA